MDIRAAVTHQHYDQEYDYPELHPLFITPRAIELIPEAASKHHLRRRGIRSGLLVRLRMHQQHPPLLRILLATVQSLDNEVDELRARISFQRDIRGLTYCFTESWLSLVIYFPRPYSQLGSLYITQTGIKNSPGRRKAVVYVS